MDSIRLERRGGMLNAEGNGDFSPSRGRVLSVSRKETSALLERLIVDLAISGTKFGSPRTWDYTSPCVVEDFQGHDTQ